MSGESQRERIPTKFTTTSRCTTTSRRKRLGQSPASSISPTPQGYPYWACREIPNNVPLRHPNTLPQCLHPMVGSPFPPDIPCMTLMPLPIMMICFPLATPLFVCYIVIRTQSLCMSLCSPSSMTPTSLFPCRPLCSFRVRIP